MARMGLADCHARWLAQSFMSGRGTTAMSASSSALRMPRATTTPVASSPCTHSVCDLDLEALAAERHDLAVAHHAHGLLAGGLGVLEHGAGDGARSEVAVVVVPPVGEAFERQRQPQLPRGLFHLRPIERHVDDLRVDHLDRAADGHGIALVVGGHVVERAVRLEVGHLEAGVAGHRLQGADLVGDHVLEVGGLHLDAAPAEAPQIVEAGMHADADPFLLGQHAQPVHRIGIAGVESAGDARRFDDLHHLGVVADVVGAPALGNVRVEVDHLGHGRFFLARIRGFWRERHRTIYEPAIQSSRPAGCTT